jgi:flagellum-specific ATP synthase
VDLAQRTPQLSDLSAETGPLALLKTLTDHGSSLPLVQDYGRVVAVEGLVVKVAGLRAPALASRCRFADVPSNQPGPSLGEVVGFAEGVTMVMPYGSVEGLGAGARVYPEISAPRVQVNQSWLGRVVDGLGQPLDGLGPLSGVGGQAMLLRATPPPAFSRQPVGPRLNTGVRVLNTLLPLCEGQRLGIFAGSGVGKSVLMGMLARHSGADVNVIGLIGERGREVGEFLQHQLGPEGRSRSVVVVATGDEPPLVRRQAAFLTMAVAEYFRDCGFKVLLMMDSVTRFAQAQRQIGLAGGEPPTTRGYTPSVFAELPKLLERAGPGVGKGSISAIFSVLVEGSDMEEPVADAVRGILDGHIVLTRALAERNHFPAIDVLQSVSRTVPQCLTQQEWQVVSKTRQLLSAYEDMAELIRLGAYTKGSDPLVDEALAKLPAMHAFLKQAPNEGADAAQSFGQLAAAVS